MSQCPYGAIAQQNAAQLLDEMGAFIDFRQEFIAFETKPGVFSSIHGSDEIEGDILQLCAQKYFPANYQFMDFVVCMARNFRAIPHCWEECARSSGIDGEVIRACATGEEGKHLLMASADISAGKNINASPTIIIGETFTLSGARDTETLKKLVCCSFATEDIPGACLSHVGSCPGKNRIHTVILTDKRCAECDRFVKNAMGALKKMFFAIDFEIVDYSEERGKNLYRKAGGGYLPMFFFSGDISGEPEFLHIADWMVPVADKYVLKPGNVFHPEKEICGNGNDDNADGKTDCDDEMCVRNLECAKPTPATLTLFVMSRCPFAKDAETAMAAVMDHFKKAIRFDLRFILDFYTPQEYDGLPPAGRKGCEKMNDGNFYCTLHGSEELREDLRQVCVRKYYAGGFRYMEYIACRNKNIFDPDWEGCLRASKMDPEKIESCTEGGEGLSLLREDAMLSAAMGITASPTFVGNGTQILSVQNDNHQDIIAAICRINKNLKACRTIDTEKKLLVPTNEKIEDNQKRCGN